MWKLNEWGCKPPDLKLDLLTKFPTLNDKKICFSMEIRQLALFMN